MPRRGENIYLRKDGRWEGRYPTGKRSNGTTRFASVYGRKYSEVKRKLALCRAAQVDAPPAESAYAACSVGEWMEFWLAENRPYIKESSFCAYRRIVTVHLAPAFGEMRLPALDIRAVQPWVDGLSARLAPSTVHNICRVFSSILSMAVERGLIAKNPLREARKPKYEVRPARYFTRPEQKRLEAALAREGRLEYLLCLYTGLRVGELCALCWEDVDFLNAELHIRRTVKRTAQSHTGRARTALALDTPKSASAVRDIPVPPFLLRELKARRKEHGFVFEGKAGGCMDPRTVQNRLARLLRTLRLSGGHMHTLRHTYSTRCMEAGVPYATLAALLGHSSAAVTLKCYAHCTAEQKRQSIGRLRPLAV